LIGNRGQLARNKKHERKKAGFFYIYFISGNSKNNKNKVNKIKKVTYILTIKIFFCKKNYFSSIIIHGNFSKSKTNFLNLTKIPTLKTVKKSIQ